MQHDRSGEIRVAQAIVWHSPTLQSDPPNAGNNWPRRGIRPDSGSVFHHRRHRALLDAPRQFIEAMPFNDELAHPKIEGHQPVAICSSEVGALRTNARISASRTLPVAACTTGRM